MSLLARPLDVLDRRRRTTGTTVDEVEERARHLIDVDLAPGAGERILEAGSRRR